MTIYGNLKSSGSFESSGALGRIWMILYGNLKSYGSFESSGALVRICVIIWKPRIFWIIQIIWCIWEDLDDYMET